MKSEIVGQEIDVTAAGGSLDLNTFDYDNLFVIARVTELTGGTTPSVDFSLVAIDDAGFETAIILASMGAAVSTVNGAASGGVGPFISGHLPPKITRLKWVTAGAPTSAKAYISGWGSK